ncbi:MAG: cytochrome C [Desulfuromonadaceae bacterium]|nr:cytochrome C [Desulfuromonadaceae bacterium]MDD5106539.1 cytochrome C [Desulfuromonadaceae bacterium]
MKYILLLVSLSVAVISGCAMMTAWKSIPPPGGCDQCHTVAISTNWKVEYKVAVMADERGRLPFQTPEYNQPLLGGHQSPLEEKKLEQMACFDCHKTPSPAHKERKGNFHH